MVPLPLLAILGALVLLSVLTLGTPALSAQQHTALGAASATGSPEQPTPETGTGFLDEYQAPDSERATLDSPDPLDIFAKLLIVLALAWLASGAMRRFLGGPGRGGSRGLIQLVETFHLGPRRSMHLVEVAGRTLLVGATEQHVELLSEWNGVAPGDEWEERPGGPQRRSSFSHQLASSMRPPDPQGTSQPAYRARTCLARLRSRVDSLGVGSHGEEQP